MSVIDAAYTRLLTPGGRDVRPRFVAIIEIGRGSSPSTVGAHTLCRQREFLAKLVHTVALAEPAVIAIVKSFEVGSCDDDPSGTNDLIQAIGTVRRAGIPVVTGRSATLSGRLLPGLSFDVLGSSKPLEGLGNQAKDARRIAFSFILSEPSLERWPTFSRTVAGAYDPFMFADRSSRIVKMQDQDIQPFISFLPENSLDDRTFQAVDILCDGRGSASDWRQCKPDSTRWAPGLRGRVVLIGDGAETYESEVGVAPWSLQANYIEAILDERVFWPGPTWLNYLLGFAVFVLFEVALSRREVWKVIVLVAALVLLVLGICYMAAALFGSFLNLTVFSLSIVMTRVLGVLPERVWAHSAGSV